MLLASNKKRWVQHVGCLPLKPHRNLPDVCSWKAKQGQVLVSLENFEKTPKTSMLPWCQFEYPQISQIFEIFFGVNHLERQMFTIHSLDLLGFLFQVMFEHGYHHWSSPFEEFVWSFFLSSKVVLTLYYMVVSNIFQFSSQPGEMIQCDEHIFQMGWFNHQNSIIHNI